MLFARAISNGVAWYCPDVVSGRVYTPEELDATAVVEEIPVGVDGFDIPFGEPDEAEQYEEEQAFVQEVQTELDAAEE